jgi:hypothetical protein
VIVSDLPAPQLRRRLRHPGLRLRTGPVVTCVRSDLADVADGIALHYAQHPVHEDDGFADFHVSVERPDSLRRWIRPQVVFRFDGEAPFAPLPGDQGFPMFEWGLNWCVSAHCHQYLVIHAAVIARGGLAVVLPAPSGSGKSTLCAGLVYGGGWRLLSDELALFHPQTGLLDALVRPVSLKNASIEAIARFAPGVPMGRVVHETVKGRVAHVAPPPEAVAQCSLETRARWIVLPRYEAGAAAALRPLPRAQAFMTLMTQAFNPQVHGAQGFDALADIVSGCDCHEFVYGDLGDACRVFEDLHGRA